MGVLCKFWLQLTWDMLPFCVTLGMFVRLKIMMIKTKSHLFFWINELNVGLFC